jgi:hypothetical protein
MPKFSCWEKCKYKVLRYLMSWWELLVASHIALVNVVENCLSPYFCLCLMLWCFCCRPSSLNIAMKMTCLPTFPVIEFNDEKCLFVLWLSSDNSKTKTAWLKLGLVTPVQELKSKTRSRSFSWNQVRRLHKLYAILNNAVSVQRHEDGKMIH